MNNWISYQKIEWEYKNTIKLEMNKSNASILIWAFTSRNRLYYILKLRYDQKKKNPYFVNFCCHV